MGGWRGVARWWLAGCLAVLMRSFPNSRVSSTSQAFYSSVVQRTSYLISPPLPWLALPPPARSPPAVKQEIDRNEDMLRSCLRAVDSLAKLPNAAQVPPFKQFMDSVVLGPALKVGGWLCWVAGWLAGWLGGCGCMGRPVEAAAVLRLWRLFTQCLCSCWAARHPTCQPRNPSRSPVPSTPDLAPALPGWLAGCLLQDKYLAIKEERQEVGVDAMDIA